MKTENCKKKFFHSIKSLDFVILAGIIAFSVFAFCNSSVADAEKILVNANGDEYIYPLNKNAVYEVQGKNGITKIEVKDSQVRIIDSPCPNKTCIAMGFSNVVVCLPNAVMVQKITSEKNKNALEEADAATDAVSR